MIASLVLAFFDDILVEHPFYLLRLAIGDLIIIQVTMIFGIFNGLLASRRLNYIERRNSLKQKYTIFIIGCGLISFLGIMDFLKDVFSILFDLYAFIAAVIGIGFIIVNYNLWLKPKKMDKLERIQIENKDITNLKTMDLSKMQIIHLVDYFGNRLCEFLEKPANACKGFIMIAMMEEYKENKMYQINTREFLRFVEEILGDKLKIMGLKGVEGFLKRILKEINENPSILTMLLL